MERVMSEENTISRTYLPVINRARPGLFLTSAVGIRLRASVCLTIMVKPHYRSSWNFKSTYLEQRWSDNVFIFLLLQNSNCFVEWELFANMVKRLDRFSLNFGFSRYLKAGATFITLFNQTEIVVIRILFKNLSSLQIQK